SIATRDQICEPSCDRTRTLAHGGLLLTGSNQRHVIGVQRKLRRRIDFDPETNHWSPVIAENLSGRSHSLLAVRRLWDHLAIVDLVKEARNVFGLVHLCHRAP